MFKTRITMSGQIEEQKYPPQKYFYCIPKQNIKTYDQVSNCYKCAEGGFEFDCPAILLDINQTCRYEKELDEIVEKS